MRTVLSSGSRMNFETRNCQNCKQPFKIESEDFGFYEKMGVLPPVLCPDCRFKRRCLFRNERALYSRKCELCGKPMISVHNPKSPYVVYCHDCWNSDKWDPYSFGQDYDFKRPFFEQLGDLMKRVPKITTYLSSYQRTVNSEYSNFAGGKGGNKNCYLVFNTGDCEDSMYSRGLRECRGVVDSYYGNYLERCYETVNVQRSSGVIWSQNVNGSVDSAFLMNVSGCQNCFGCVNLRMKSHYFFNEPTSKDEYEKKTEEIMGSYSKTKEFAGKFREFSMKFPRRENNNLKAVDSSGDFIFESKNVQHGFEVSESENCKYIFFIKTSKDSYDLTGFGYESELLLEDVAVGFSSRVIGSYQAENSHNMEYCFAIKNCEYCIGCDGLKNSKYTVLNKKYNEAEYKKIHEHIVKELKEKNLLGFFMPPEIAPFAYNETIGQDEMPLKKEEALAQGFRWEDDIQITKGKETLKPERIPDHISDVPDSIVNEILACINCGRNYKIIRPELDFYRRLIVPLPRICFDCRHLDRIKRRGPFKLFDRKCDKCGKLLKTNFAPNRPEVVYCEQCYQAEVV